MPVSEVQKTGEGDPSVSEHEVPEKKRTSLGLYVTAQGAYAMWAAEPERVNVLDVRTPEEYIFVGHAAMARNIPLLFICYQWDAGKDEPVVRPNPDFVSRARELFAATGKLLVMRRSGRSALAVNALAQAGFVNVYNIIDGMEGDEGYDNNWPAGLRVSRIQVPFPVPP